MSGWLPWASVPECHPTQTVPLPHYGNLVAMDASGRAAVWLGSVLSGCGRCVGSRLPRPSVRSNRRRGGRALRLAYGGLAVLAHAWGGWRKAALVGTAISTITLLVATAEVVSFVLAE
jgi:hypothetical protein